MTVPTRRTVGLLGAGFPLALLPALLHARWWSAWAAWLAAIGVGLLAEWILAVPARRLQVEARLPPALHVGERGVLRIALRSRWRWPVRVEAVCDLDELLSPSPVLPARVGGAGATLACPLVPLRRGRTTVSAVWLRWEGPLGLLRFTGSWPVGRSVPVLPNVRAVRAAAIRFFGARQLVAGLKCERYLGDGSEFESLREHARGMDARAIDWKATARHRKLLGRQYRAERNHPLVLALDTGRLMSETLLGIPKLDHAISAALLLGYVALKTGDRVGLFAFDEAVRDYLAPQGGVQSFPRLQLQTAALAYSHAETNFTSGLLDLGARLRRRTLVVVLTDFVDTVTAGVMVDNLARLRRSHRVLFVALRDTSLDGLVRKAPRRLEDLHRAVCAHDLVRERDVVLARLRRMGVGCVDAPPAAVTSRLLNAYLEVKRRELL